MTPEDVAYLQEQARQRGYSGDDLLRVMRYESGGDPTRWGGKGNKYFGLIQFGGPERAQFGVDTEHPNARNQIDAAFRFLAARGFKPGMGLLDLYSTINAGSPGHYTASDRPGMSVASHVQKMLGQGAAPSAPSVPLPGSFPSPSQTAPRQSEDLTPYLSAQASPSPLVGLLGSAAQPAPAQDDEQVQASREFHRLMHERALAGLLNR